MLDMLSFIVPICVGILTTLTKIFRGGLDFSVRLGCPRK